jgi:hypothetical protein
MNAPARDRTDATDLDKDDEPEGAPCEPGMDPSIPEGKRGENGEHNDRPHVEEIPRVERSMRP